VLPTFPSRYWSTIGLPEVFSLAGWSPRFRTGFLVSRPTQVAARSCSSFPVRGCHPLCRAFPGASRSLRSRFLPLLRPRQRLDARGLGSVPFARHYSGHRCFFLFLRVLRCFSSPRSPLMNQVAGLQPAGLPHSDIRGSQPVCGSPRLFAAYHVLLRLRKPRHPPFALLLFL
jgi:hypothetical protein